MVRIWKPISRICTSDCAPSGGVIKPFVGPHIPKDGKGGKTRPIGISCFEDKIVQRALTEVLTAVYEQDFRDCSYAYRKGRSAHDALRVLDRVAMNREANWVQDAT